jgi:hypothetical protein
MFDLDETIDAFRRGELDFDCKQMVLTQHRNDGKRFKGQGYIRQAQDGALTFKLYVTEHNDRPFSHTGALFANTVVVLSGNESYYDLDIVGCNGIRWTGVRILPKFHWDFSDMSVLVEGEINSIIAHLDFIQQRHVLRLHFFEEYDLPLPVTSEIEQHGCRSWVSDRAKFEACGSEFEIRKRDGSGDTVIEITSKTGFIPGYDLRIQEALQYITAKPAIWRARVQSVGEGLHLELSSPRPKSSHTRLSPPISRGASHFHKYTWCLFIKYLSYVTKNNNGTYWSPVAYHIYNACEATATSIDTHALAISIAIEALSSLISIELDDTKVNEIKSFQNRIYEWVLKQSDVPEDITRRLRGQIQAMGRRRPQDKLHVLAANGHVTKDYIRAWANLRNRHVHPTIEDLKKPDLAYFQDLLDHIHRAEVLLWQITFYLIGYEGPFTDYGTHGAPEMQYPLKLA